MTEILDAIFSFSDGKTPGPDGLGIEFYKAVFPLIKDDLVRLYNGWFEGGFIPARNKAGLITLIPKEGPLDEMKNYRPINLINVDLKIYTKILCIRLKPVLNELLHDTQFSQPGKNIGQLVNLIRDLRDDMAASSEDSFLLKIDFMKAFDNVDHNYIVKVLSRMNFPSKFIDAFRSLYKNASSKLLINGLLSKRIQIKSGIRQGDPLSKDVFTLSLNPLIEVLNDNQEVVKYDTVSRQRFLTLAFVDDVNAITRQLRSVSRILELIEVFGNISGFQINLLKTEGYFCNQEKYLDTSRFPTIKWVGNMKMLGVCFGSDSWEQEQWENKFIEFKREVAFLKSKCPTFDARAMLSKFKLCSMFSYIAQVFPVPERLREKISDQMVKFMVPHGKTILTDVDFSLPRRYGGYGVSNVLLHLDLCFIKPIIQYINEKVNNVSLSSNQSFVEYNIGHLLCRKFNLRLNNSTVHRFQPNVYYKHMYDVISKYKITLEEFINGKISKIYYRVVCEYGEQKAGGVKYNQLHKNIFPNYLKTFNFKINFDLLPVKGKFHQLSLDAQEKITCPFCNINLETAAHIFANCVKLKKVWNFLDEALKVCFNNQCKYSFLKQRRVWNFSLVDCKCESKYVNLILYLNSVVNFNIWKLRNLIFHENVIFNDDQIIGKVISTITARRNMENSLKSCNQIEHIQPFSIALASIRDAMYDPG